MAKSPLILAALANDAAPKLTFNSVKPIGSSDGLFDSALLTEAQTGQHYIIKMPRDKVAGLALDTELSVIRSINDERRSRLPFEITKVVGSTFDADGTRAIVFSFVYGNPIEFTTLPAEHPLAENVGQAIAAIHNLPLELIENAGLPSFNPLEAITLRVAELDKARETGKIPASLNQRWEQAFEDVSLFKYQPCVIHSDLNGDSLLELDGQVSGLLNLTSLRIGDPAEDFAFVMGSQNFDAAYNTLLAYQSARPSADANIKQRATLYSELEIVRWLIYNMKRNNEVEVNHAQELLIALANEVEAGEAPSLASNSMAANSNAGREFGHAMAANVAADEAAEPLASGDFIYTPQEPIYDAGDLSMPVIGEGAFAAQQAQEAVDFSTRPIDIVPSAASSESDLSGAADDSEPEQTDMFSDAPIAEVGAVEKAVEADESGDFDERDDQTRPAKDDELF